MNKKCVPEGSFIKCSFAEATNIKRLKVTHNNNVLIYGKKMATEGDKEFLENIPQFDKCKKGECKFCAVGNWEPLGEKAMIGNNRLLLENSKIKCEKGGILSLYLTLEEAKASIDLGNMLISQFDFDFSLGQGIELSVSSFLSMAALNRLPINLFHNFDMLGFVVYGSGKESKNPQKLYRETIEAGLKNGKIIKIEKNGKIYYKILDKVEFRNYNYTSEGEFIFSEIDGDLKLFIVKQNTDEKGIIHRGVSVPFGEFISKETNESILSYISNNKDINGVTFIHYHMRSADKKNVYMSNEDLVKEAGYFSNRKNSKKVGNSILNYLQDKKNLDQTAGDWSGSSYESKFSGEIEAHADLLLNRTAITKFLRATKFNKSDIEYFNSAGIADMGNFDKDMGKKVMDILW